VPYAIRYLFAYHAKALHLALKVIIRAIGRYYIQKSGIKKSQVGSVTLIQRFGSSAGNLNVHFHILFVDGVFDKDANYHGVSAPTNDEVAQLVHKIKVRVLRSLEKKGYIQGYDVNLEEDKLYQEHGARICRRLPPKLTNFQNIISGFCRRLPPKLTNFQNIISGSKHSAQRVGRNFIGLS